MKTPELGLSLILPVYNEQDNIEVLHQEIANVLKKIDVSAEVIYINDGSDDGTLKKLLELKNKNEQVIIVDFGRNFGQTAAMSAGFDLARGEIIITMDADRQNDPADIPALLEKINQGFDLVSGWRFDRQDNLVLRRLPSKIANRLISYTTDIKLHDYGCSLKAFRHKVAKQLSLYGEMHRFIPAIASWYGVKIGEIKVNHRARVAGISKYGISRIFRVILDLITVKFLLSYSSRPLQFFGSIGLVSTILGVFVSMVLTMQKLFYNIGLSDRPLLLLGILLIFIGLQFITVGLLAELMTRTYHEAQNKPTYSIRNIYR